MAQIKFNKVGSEYICELTGVKDSFNIQLDRVNAGEVKVSQKVVEADNYASEQIVPNSKNLSNINFNVIVDVKVNMDYKIISTTEVIKGYFN